MSRPPATDKDHTPSGHTTLVMLLTTAARPAPQVLKGELDSAVLVACESAYHAATTRSDTSAGMVSGTWRTHLCTKPVEGSIGRVGLPRRSW